MKEFYIKEFCLHSFTIDSSIGMKLFVNLHSNNPTYKKSETYPNIVSKLDNSLDGTNIWVGIADDWSYIHNLENDIKYPTPYLEYLHSLFTKPFQILSIHLTYNKHTYLIKYLYEEIELEYERENEWHNYDLE